MSADAARDLPDESKRDFIYILTLAAAGGAVAGLAWPLIDQMNPSADTLAMRAINVEFSKVELGQQIVVKWQGKPVFIRHRTAAEIAAAVADDGTSMRDPARDEDRHKPGMAEWLIVIGVCTHLGCVPTFGGGEYGGWFCPCHGSVYDTAGRIRKGPAPKNLFLPDYVFESASKVKIG
jgi:ubiquinol-cytochrome c reductase iron-sulfur subunit